MIKPEEATGEGAHGELDPFQVCPSNLSSPYEESESGNPFTISNVRAIIYSVYFIYIIQVYTGRP